MHRVFTCTRNEARLGSFRNRQSLWAALAGSGVSALLVLGLMVAGATAGPGDPGLRTASNNSASSHHDRHDGEQELQPGHRPHEPALHQRPGPAATAGHPELCRRSPALAQLPRPRERPGPAQRHRRRPAVEPHLRLRRRWPTSCPPAGSGRRPTPRTCPAIRPTTRATTPCGTSPGSTSLASHSMPVANSTSLIADLNGANAPSFVLVHAEPDQRRARRTGSAGRRLPGRASSRWSRPRRGTRLGGQIIITWDESNDSSGLNGGDGGHVATIVVSAANKANPIKDTTPVDTAGLLRSVEDRYALPHLGGAANAANGTIDCLLGAAGTCTTH